MTVGMLGTATLVSPQRAIGLVRSTISLFLPDEDQQENVMADPKCPSCGVVGVDKVVSTKSAQQSKGGDSWFEIAHCSDCGHIYNVFPKVVLSPTPPRLVGR